MNNLKEVWGKEAMDSLVKIEIIVRDEYQKNMISAKDAMEKIIHVLN